MTTRKLRFSVLQLKKKRPMKKVPEKYIFLRFDLIGNAYSAGDKFHFSINLIQDQKHVNKKRSVTYMGYCTLRNVC